MIFFSVWCFPKTRLVFRANLDSWPERIHPRWSSKTLLLFLLFWDSCFFKLKHNCLLLLFIKICLSEVWLKTMFAKCKIWSKANLNALFTMKNMNCHGQCFWHRWLIDTLRHQKPANPSTTMINLTKPSASPRSGVRVIKLYGSTVIVRNSKAGIFRTKGRNKANKNDTYRAR